MTERDRAATGLRDMESNDESTAASAACWTLRVRGALEIERGGEAVDLRPKERSVLAALVVTHPTPADTDRIATLIWGDSVPGSAHKSIQNHVARIRRSVGDVVITQSGGYALSADATIDLSAPGSSSALFTDLADTPEVEAQRERIRARILTDDERSLESAVAGGLDGDVIQRLHAAVIDEPYREHRWALLASAQHALGDRRQALLTCQAARRRLAEVGLPPGDRLADLERAILGSDDDHTGVPGRTAHVRPTLHPHFDEPFVGRSGVLDALHTAWASTLELRRPSLVVLTGRAGIGKTRLADRFCEEIFERDTAVRVVWGRHRGTGGRAYGALTEALLRLLASEPELAAIHAATERTIRLAAAGSDPDTSASGDGRDLRQAVIELTRTIAQHPTVWFVDDLHWASNDSLALLEEALDGASGPILVVATSRPTDVGNDAAIGALERVVPTQTIEIDPLTIDDVAALIETPEHSSNRGLAAEIHDRTGGLSLYVSEIARTARRQGTPIDPADIPTAIREWVTHRVRALPPADAGLLRLAAVIGRHVDPPLLAACSPYGLGEVTARCDDLITNGFFTIGDTATTVQFSHTITRDIVLDSIGPLERARLHGHVGRILAERGDGELEHATIAHHLSQAGESFAEDAAVHAVAAGNQEFSDGAWQRASNLFRLARDMARTPATRGQALVGLGRALLCSEAFDDAAAALHEARDLAIDHELPMIEGASALALSGRAGRGAARGAAGAAVDEALRQAIRHLTGTPGREAAILQSDLERELAFSLLLSNARDERDELLRGSLARMRALDPPAPRPLAAALLGNRYTRLDAPGLEARLAEIDEVLALPRRRVGPETLIAAHCYLHEDLVRTGDFVGATRALDAATELAARFPEPYWRWSITTWRYLEALHDGDLERAEDLARAAADTRRTVVEAQACLAVNLVNIRLYQGRPADMMPTLAGAVELHPEIPAYRAVLAFCTAEAGGLDDARTLLRTFDDADYRNLPADTNRFLALALLGHVAATVDAERAGARLRTLLEPYRDQWVVLACYGGGGASWGPTTHVLARLAALAGEFDVAETEFSRAVDAARHAPLALARIEDDRRRSVRPAARTTTARQHR